MSLFKIDQQKCTKCGICAEVCPTTLIELQDSNSFPTPVKGKICINCGHCAAACPHEALWLEKMPLDQCPPVNQDLLMSDQQLAYNFWARRTITAYKEEPVDRDIITRAIDTTRYSPTFMNARSVQWVVVYERKEVKRMIGMAVNCLRYLKKKEQLFGTIGVVAQLLADYESGIDHISYNAPHIVVAHAPKEDSSSETLDIHLHETDCTTALTHLALILPSFGLGSCRAIYFDIAVKLWPPLQKALGIPRANANYGSLLLGNPKYKYYRLPMRDKTVVTWR